eukprot:TRINITY_DN5019_c0_g1_i1.p1 TRINITY_DN5019_c0_g1~~TRINITY_DN5019_c0_g1_i1.p1  ORF type:complete len:286 (+),score=28.87 TRINITY_DN5019_c0_g1_i1:31-888(+)
MTDSPSFFKSFLAGGCGQIVELLTLGHIATRVATEQQANPSYSVLKSIKNIYVKQGFLGYYQGLRWNIVMGFLKGASRWGLNNTLYNFFTPMFEKESRLVPVAVAVTGAFIETTLILCPFESLRTLDMTTSPGIKLDLWDKIRQEKLRVFFRGWNRIFFRQIVTWVTYLSVYDIIRQKIMKYRGDKINSYDKVFVGMATGATASILNTPLDMLKTQIQKNEPLNLRIVSAVKEIMAQHGIYGFYSSFFARVCRSSWYSLVTFTVMDQLNALPERMRLKRVEKELD